ncbi:MAG: hypothetical protein RI988_2711 [Pseudomonadota bacterium]|jgi:outer membrane protein TolC
MTMDRQGVASAADARPPFASAQSPAEPSVGPAASRRDLSAAEVVRAALTEGLGMRVAVDNLGLQAQQLATVNRRAFLPKVSTFMGVQRQVGIETGLPPTGVRSAQAAVNVAWQLRTGGVVAVTRALDVGGAGGVSRPDAGSGVISISQPLLRGFGSAVAEAGLEAAESGFRLAVKDVRAMAASIVAQALGAYVEVQTAQAAAVQAREALQLAQHLHEVNHTLVEAGRSARVVLLQSESDIALARAGAAQAENAQRLAIRALAQLMRAGNAFEQTELVLTDELASDSAMADAAGHPTSETDRAFLDRVLTESRELLAAREALRLAERQLQLAENAQLPGLALTASYGDASLGATGGRRRDTQVGLLFEHSFDAAERKLALRAAQLALQQARDALTDTERRLREAATDAWRQHEFAAEQVRLARRTLAGIERQLDSELTRQRMGRTSQLELTSVQRALSDAQRQFRAAQVQLYLGRTQLELLDGSLLARWGMKQTVDAWVTSLAVDSQP